MNWFAKEMNLPYVDSYKKQCLKCNGEMEVLDKTTSKRRQAKIIDLHGICINCNKIIQASGTHTAENAISEFNRIYNNELMKKTLKPGKYKCETGNLWNYAGKVDAICITTNGVTNTQGKAVMGRGCAKQATDRYPGIAYKLGKFIKEYGNRAFKIMRDLTNEKNPTWIVSFPVKPIYKLCESPEEIKENVVNHMIDSVTKQLKENQSNGKKRVSVPGWAACADINIITESAKQLVIMADKFNWKTIVCPMMGCGAGQLDWETQVKPILDNILDQRFILVTYPSEKQ